MAVEDREGIILHRRLTEAAHEWELLERDVARSIAARVWHRHAD
jgi:hypothetical protein